MWLRPRLQLLSVIHGAQAVVVIGNSKSYVFVIFFRALFLVVTIGGIHGLWLLPALLALVGGSSVEHGGAKVQPDSDKRDKLVAAALGQERPPKSVE